MVVREMAENSMNMKLEAIAEALEIMKEFTNKRSCIIIAIDFVTVPMIVRRG